MKGVAETPTPERGRMVKGVPSQSFAFDISLFHIGDSFAVDDDFNLGREQSDTVEVHCVKQKL